MGKLYCSPPSGLNYPLMIFPQNTKPLPFKEFVALMAVMTSLTALNIDAMLPALPDIGHALNVDNENHNQLIISIVFLGMALGQLFYGPFADSQGRKPAVYLGLACFLVGSLICIVSQNLTWMLLGRMLQGFGLAAPRTISMAIVRDQFSGNDMARVMSFIMAVFIIVPALAPAIGQGIIWVSGWKMIFAFFIFLAVLVGIWFAIRQPETLKPEYRREFSRVLFLTGLKELFRHPVVMGYTVASGLVTACLIVYLSLAQQIFQVQYDLYEYFPLVFAVLALIIGLASYLNGKLVSHYGMANLSLLAVVTLMLMALIMWPLSWIYMGHPPFEIFLGYCAVSMFCVGILFGNLASMAMEPVGHIAGLGAALIGSLATFIALPLAVLFAQSYDGTIIPLVSAFAVFSFFTLIVFVWAQRQQRKLQQQKH